MEQGLIAAACARQACVQEQERAEAGGRRDGVGCARTFRCGRDFAHVPAVDVLVEGARTHEHCGRPTMRRQEHSPCVSNREIACTESLGRIECGRICLRA